MSASTAADARFVGVTIELPEPYGSELAAWRERLGDPSAAKIPPHITLLPPTRLEAAALDRFAAHLADVASAHEPFHVRLKGSDTFPPGFTGRLRRPRRGCRRMRGGAA